MWKALAELGFYNYERGAPGPGFLPFWLSLGLIILGIVLTVQEAKVLQSPGEKVAQTSEQEAIWPTAGGWLRIGYVMVPFAIALSVFEWLGFIATTVCYIAVVGFGLGMRSGKVLVPVALLIGFGLYGLFSIGFEVSLPKGILSF